jgi:hypothetical protein
VFEWYTRNRMHNPKVKTNRVTVPYVSICCAQNSRRHFNVYVLQNILVVQSFVPLV